MGTRSSQLQYLLHNYLHPTVAARAIRRAEIISVFVIIQWTGFAARLSYLLVESITDSLRGLNDQVAPIHTPAVHRVKQTPKGAENVRMTASL